MSFSFLATGRNEAMWKRTALLDKRRRDEQHRADRDARLDYQFDIGREDRLAKESAEREDKLAKQAVDDDFRYRQEEEKARQFDLNREDRLSTQAFNQEWTDVFNSQMEEENELKLQKMNAELDAFNKLREEDDAKRERMNATNRSALSKMAITAINGAKNPNGTVYLSQGQLENLRQTPGGMLQNLVSCVQYDDQYGESCLLVTFSDPEIGADGKPVVDANGNQVPRTWNLDAKQVRKIVSDYNFGDEKQTNLTLGAGMKDATRSRIDTSWISAREKTFDRHEKRMEQIEKLLPKLETEDKIREELLRERRQIQKFLANNGRGFDGSLPDADGEGSANTWNKGSGVRKLGGKSISTATGRYASATRSGGENASESTKDQSGELVNVNGRTFVNGQIYQTPKGLLRAVVKDGKLMWSRK